eukprot:TRINITY_DN12215_c0_g1_i1.p1 TRINITY_DN12215_c0_g1~~TRINITY_DN12215_c0_g1_i1.p1  ORF type:complete len:531 (+),score=21.57 TRINITY_DN12215_c0_g1_i1:60-1652(+)
MDFKHYLARILPPFKKFLVEHVSPSITLANAAVLCLLYLDYRRNNSKPDVDSVEQFVEHEYTGHPILYDELRSMMIETGHNVRNLADIYRPGRNSLFTHNPEGKTTVWLTDSKIPIIKELRAINEGLTANKIGASSRKVCTPSTPTPSSTASPAPPPSPVPMDNTFSSVKTPRRGTVNKTTAIAPAESRKDAPLPSPAVRPSKERMPALVVPHSSVPIKDSIFNQDNLPQILIPLPTLSSSRFYDKVLPTARALVEKLDPSYPEHKQFVYMGEISQGALATVRTALWGDIQVAVKSIRHNNDDRIKEAAHREYEIHQLCSGPFVVPILKMFDKSKKTLLVTELSGYCDMATVIKNGPLSNIQATLASCDLLSGMVRIHANEYGHFDLKPENLFPRHGKLNEYTAIIEVGDFGCARRVPKGGRLMGVQGTYTYMAPEVYLNQGYTEEADLFSAAVTIWSFYTGRRVFEGLNPEQVAERHSRGERETFDERFPEGVKEIIESCWQQKDVNRCTALEALAKMRAVVLRLLAQL